MSRDLRHVRFDMYAWWPEIQATNAQIRYLKWQRRPDGFLWQDFLPRDWLHN